MFREWLITHYHNYWMDYLDLPPVPFYDWVQQEHPEVWKEYLIENVPHRVLQAILKDKDVVINDKAYVREDIAGLTVDDFVALCLQINHREMEDLLWLSSQ